MRLFIAEVRREPSGRDDVEADILSSREADFKTRTVVSVWSLFEW